MAQEDDRRIDALEDELEQLRGRMRRLEGRMQAEAVTVSNKKGSKRVLRLADDGESVEVE